MNGAGAPTGRTRTWLRVAVMVDITVVILEVLGFGIVIGMDGLTELIYYTIDSNILAGVACAIGAMYGIRRLTDGTPVPEWVGVLKFCAAVCLALTFIVVICFLLYMYNGDVDFLLVQGAMPIHHIICPFLVTISYVLFDSGKNVGIREMIISLVPFSVYGMIMFPLNFLHIMDGPYQFLRVYAHSMFITVSWVVALTGIALIVAGLIAMARNMIDGKFIEDNQ
jgi:hypothetical protein